MTIRNRLSLILPLLIVTLTLAWAGQAEPIIDVHVHTWFPAMAQAYNDDRYTNAQVMHDYLRVADELHVLTSVLSGPDPKTVNEWRKRDTARFVPALMIDTPMDTARREQIRRWVQSGQVAVLGEVGLEYAGLSPKEPAYEEYFKLASELDVPLAIHMGPVTPAKTLLGLKGALVRNGDPLLLEDVLTKYPKVRLQVMHAGWPFTDHMIAIMTAYPNVYVDIANTGYVFGRNDLHYHLKRMVDAGLGKRIMWGSDTSGPSEIEKAVRESLANVQSADFLTPEQKRDILHDNAVRFFRLSLPPGR
jgi:predicted TIM-barrel fold metal-dependent hydrolase